MKIVSTDSEHYKNIALEYGARSSFFKAIKYIS